MIDGLVRFRPEDASSLGVEEAYGRLSDPSALAAEEEWVRGLALPDDPLDRDATRRFQAFHVDRFEYDDDLVNLEKLLLPNAAIHHARFHGKEDGHRRRALPDYLRAQQANLAKGIAKDRVWDRDIAILFATHLLPAAAESTGEPLYLDLAKFVNDEIVPRTIPNTRLGERRVKLRLHDVMGVETPIPDLLRIARRELASAKNRFSPDVAKLFARRFGTIDEAVATYRRHVEEATTFARRFMTIPDDLALSFEPLPKGIADGTSLTNWPAPLLDPKAKGHVLYSPNLDDHSAIAARNLAVHEAIPGHYLQSAIWQRSKLSPIRFVGIADDVAMSDGYFGTMLAVEGWSVFMERRMLREGFYETPEEHEFFALCDAIRAARVIVDLEFHTEVGPIDELIEFMSEATTLPIEWAKAQLIRARRMPLQPLTYLVGALELEALQLEPNALLSEGPVPPSRLRGGARENGAPRGA